MLNTVEGAVLAAWYEASLLSRATASLVGLFSITALTLLTLSAQIVLRRRRTHRLDASVKRGLPSDEKKELAPGGFESTASTECYEKIEPLLDFDWQTTEPIKYRPYKPKYHLTMSIENAKASELVEMDKNYLQRLKIRRRLMAENPGNVLAAANIARPAVDEFYTWMVSTLLPARFPRIFEIRTNFEVGRQELWNYATQTFTPLVPAADPLKTLEALGSIVEDDFLFLMPADDGDGYQLKAFVFCFPNGFDMRKKFNLKLRDIHKPVPGYKEKLEKSMDRYFDRLEVGTFIRRVNWTITPFETLFNVSGNHLYAGDVPQPVEIDIDKTFVRSERQMVHRLPRTKAIIFSIKTYLYPIRDIKEEGLGDALADAIDGLGGGNVPAMHFYKRAAEWGESTKRYLRS